MPKPIFFTHVSDRDIYITLHSSCVFSLILHLNFKTFRYRLWEGPVGLNTNPCNPESGILNVEELRSGGCTNLQLGHDKAAFVVITSMWQRMPTAATISFGSSASSRGTHDEEERACKVELEVEVEARWWPCWRRAQPQVFRGPLMRHVIVEVYLPRRSRGYSSLCLCGPFIIE